MRYARQRALVPFMPPASTTRCVAAPSPVSRAVSSGKAATATAAAPVGARAAHTEHRSLRGRSRGGCTARVSGCAADFPLEIGSKRALSSASLASDGEDVSVVEDGTESFLVAQRKLVVGHVLFGCTSGTLSAVGSRHSIQVTAGLHLTVSDDLQLMNHSCTPNCQLELVEASSTTGKVNTRPLKLVAWNSAREVFSVDFLCVRLSVHGDPRLAGILLWCSLK